MLCDNGAGMNARGRTLLLATALLMAAWPGVAQTVIWTSGTFTYDGAGNIRATEADTYVYDELGRLRTGTADQERTGASHQQSYTYDLYGNRLTTSTAPAGCVGGCAPNVAVDSHNHLTDHGASYDASGNLKTFDSFGYEYDGIG